MIRAANRNRYGRAALCGCLLGAIFAARVPLSSRAEFRLLFGDSQPLVRFVTPTPASGSEEADLREAPDAVDFSADWVERRLRRPELPDSVARAAAARGAALPAGTVADAYRLADPGRLQLERSDHELRLQVAASSQDSALFLADALLEDLKAALASAQTTDRKPPPDKLREEETRLVRQLGSSQPEADLSYRLEQYAAASARQRQEQRDKLNRGLQLQQSRPVFAVLEPTARVDDRGRSLLYLFTCLAGGAALACLALGLQRSAIGSRAF